MEWQEKKMWKVDTKKKHKKSYHSIEVVAAQSYRSDNDGDFLACFIR